MTDGHEMGSCRWVQDTPMARRNDLPTMQTPFSKLGQLSKNSKNIQNRRFRGTLGKSSKNRPREHRNRQKMSKNALKIAEKYDIKSYIDRLLILYNS